jgi:hypothetical protein
VRFYRDVLGTELLYGGEGTGFSSLRTRDAQSAILNLERGEAVTRWGRLIFYVSDVDALWKHIRIFKSSSGGREQVLSVDGPGSSVALEYLA